MAKTDKIKTYLRIQTSATVFKYSYRMTHICCHTNFIHSYFTSVISYCMSWSHIQEQKPTQMTCIKSYKQHKHNSTYQYIRISSNGYLVPCSMYTISMIIDHKPKHVNVKSTPFKFGAMLHNTSSHFQFLFSKLLFFRAPGSAGSSDVV